LSDILKAMMLVPIVLSASIALVFLSYVFVPVMIVTFVGMIVFAAVKSSKGEEI